MIQSRVYALIFLGVLCLFGCGEEADRFDFSKVIGYEFTRDELSLSYDTLATLDIVDNGNLDDYKEYAEAYQVNQLLYEIIPLEGNEATVGLVRGSVSITGEQVPLFEIGELPVVAGEGVLEVSEEILARLSQEINQAGVLSVAMHSEADDTPGSFLFILKFDITVAVNFDVL